jgi:hypothetical protein
MQGKKSQFLQNSLTSMGILKLKDRMISKHATEIAIVVGLFISFLCITPISMSLKSTLDTLPMRLAAVILVLGAVFYDKYIALGLFLVITAIYIQHHHEEILNIIGTNNNVTPFNSALNQKHNSTMQKLEHGGNADELYDTADFTSKTEDQDNEFKPVDSTINEKHALNTEPLGTRAQILFPDDSKHVNAMEHGNKNGFND